MKRNFLLTGAVLTAILFVLYHEAISRIMAPILTALILTYLASPFVKVLSSRLPKVVSAVLFYALIIGCMVLIIFFVLPSLLSALSVLSSCIPAFKEKIRTFFPFLNFSDSALMDYLSKSSSRIFSFLSNLTSFISKTTIAITLSCLLLADKRSAKERLATLLPKQTLDSMAPTFRELDTVIKRFLHGQLLVSVLLALSTFVALVLFGVPYALLLALFYGVFCLIPSIGPLIGGIPAVAVAYLQSPSTALWIFLAMVATQMLDNTFLSPKIKADSVDISAAAAFLSMYLGGSLFGFFGVVFGVPLFACLKIIFRRLLSTIV